MIIGDAPNAVDPTEAFVGQFAQTLPMRISDNSAAIVVVAIAIWSIGFPTHKVGYQRRA
jgi:hypothetical protein